LSSVQNHRRCKIWTHQLTKNLQSVTSTELAWSNFDESEIKGSSMPNVWQFKNQINRGSGNQNQHTRDKMIWGWDVTQWHSIPSQRSKINTKTCLNVDCSAAASHK
jgi:hypothetical protein